MTLTEVRTSMNVAFPVIPCTISCPLPGCCYTNREVRRLLQKHLSPDTHLRVVR